MVIVNLCQSTNMPIENVRRLIRYAYIVENIHWNVEAFSIIDASYPNGFTDWDNCDGIICYFTDAKNIYEAGRKGKIVIAYDSGYSKFTAYGIPKERK